MPVKKLPIRVLQCGLGEIGLTVVRQIAARPGFRLVGAVDLDPAKIGRDLGQVAGLDRSLRIKVGEDLVRTIRSSKPDVVVLSTAPSMKAVWPHVESILNLKIPVVSTAEELVYPAGGNVRTARRIHELARRRRVAVLGVGVNPGFAVDALPIALTAACDRVDSIRVERVEDASVRSYAVQQRIGCGLTREQFQRKVDEGAGRHIGLAESISMIAGAMGWRLDRITDDVHPRIAVQTVASEFVAVDPGYVCGIVQDGRGFRGATELVHLHLEIYLGAHDPHDAVTIEGSPRIAQRIAGGIHGDTSTAALAANAIPRVLLASPGLHTMRDMPLPAWFAGSATAL